MPTMSHNFVDGKVIAKAGHDKNIVPAQLQVITEFSIDVSVIACSWMRRSCFAENKRLPPDKERTLLKHRAFASQRSHRGLVPHHTSITICLLS